MNEYEKFLEKKAQLGSFDGFKPLFLPDSLFDFQSFLVDWALRKGKSALFEDCGLGKTIQQLVWAENIARKTNKPVLIATPLAVSSQTVKEGEKFGIDCFKSVDGKIKKKIIITNYERLHYFNPNDFVGMCCDESSILKSFDGVRKEEITEFMKKMKYRLLCTATAAPNDYPELGTSSEALGEMGYIDMLSHFFKNDQNSLAPVEGRYRKPIDMFSDEGKWRFKGHSEQPFWKWVCSWARAIRKPSDIGFEDDKFLLPPLEEQEHLVKLKFSAQRGNLSLLPARGLKEQRKERSISIVERCEKAASLVNNTKEAAIVWCHLNSEGDLLQKLIPDCKQVSGKDSNDKKEEILTSFAEGKIRVLVTKPKIGAWGLNFQHCAHEVFFPSHSFEQYYQGVRRCWRFGQKRKVHIDIVSTEGEQRVLQNLQKKAKAADQMFSNLINLMNESIKIDNKVIFNKKEEVPSWL
jgi:hypothetical protein